MPKPFKKCSLCGVDSFKNPTVTVFTASDISGNPLFLCELHFDADRIVSYRDGRKR